MLLVINGAPGVGKSTLARQYADEHPLALVIDIDGIRTQLGQWAELGESKLVARDLAAELARAHMQNGHDVIVPQYLGRPEYRERLRLLARENDVVFVEVLLTDDADRITRRFRERRAQHATTGTAHPEADLDDATVAAEVLLANEQLAQDATARGVLVISAAAGLDAAFGALRDGLSRHGRAGR